jgi:hypothetical protein
MFGSGDARKSDELFAMQTVEVGDVAHPDLEEVVNVAGHQIAVENERQFTNGRLERPKLSGVERSRTTPTTTSVPRSIRSGASMAG